MHQNILQYFFFHPRTNFLEYIEFLFPSCSLIDFHNVENVRNLTTFARRSSKTPRRTDKRLCCSRSSRGTTKWTYVWGLYVPSRRGERCVNWLSVLHLPRFARRLGMAITQGIVHQKAFDKKVGGKTVCCCVLGWEKDNAQFPRNKMKNKMHERKRDATRRWVQLENKPKLIAYATSDKAHKHTRSHSYTHSHTHR